MLNAAAASQVEIGYVMSSLTLGKKQITLVLCCHAPETFNYCSAAFSYCFRVLYQGDG